MSKSRLLQSFLAIILVFAVVLTICPAHVVAFAEGMPIETISGTTGGEKTTSGSDPQEAWPDDSGFEDTATDGEGLSSQGTREDFSQIYMSADADGSQQIPPQFDQSPLWDGKTPLNLRRGNMLQSIVAPPALNSIRTFYIANEKGNLNGGTLGMFSERNCELLAIGTNCLVYADKEANRYKYSKAQLTSYAQALVAEYDKPNGIHQLITETFGDFYDRDNNGGQIILLTDIDDDGETATSYVGGFFYGLDFLTRNSTYKYSNEADILYMDIGTLGGWKHLSTSIQQFYNTMAHELQHLANYSAYYRTASSNNRLDEVWLNEGLSVLAEYLYGGHLENYKVARAMVSDFYNYVGFFPTDSQWHSSGAKVFSHYGAAGLAMISYVMGGGDPAALLNDYSRRGNSMAKVAAHYPPSSDFNQFFKDTMLRVYVNSGAYSMEKSSSNVRTWQDLYAAANQIFADSLPASPGVANYNFGTWGGKYRADMYSFLTAAGSGAKVSISNGGAGTYYIIVPDGVAPITESAYAAAPKKLYATLTNGQSATFFPDSRTYFTVVCVATSTAVSTTSSPMPATVRIESISAPLVPEFTISSPTISQNDSVTGEIILSNPYAVPFYGVAGGGAYTPRVTFTLPAGVTIVPGSATGLLAGGWEKVAENIYDYKGDITERDATIPLGLQFLGSTAGTKTITATMTAPASAGGNQASLASFTVQKVNLAPVLTLIGANTIENNTTTTFTLHLNNTSDQEYIPGISKPVVALTLPAGVQIVSGAGNGWTGNSTNLIWTYGGASASNITAGGASVSTVLTVKGTTLGIKTLVSRLTFADDGNLADNVTTSVPVTVDSFDLKPVVTPPVSEVKVLAPTTYTVQLENVGIYAYPAPVSEATRARMSLVLPAGAKVDTSNIPANWRPYPEASYIPGTVGYDAKLAACKIWSYNASIGVAATTPPLMIQHTPISVAAVGTTATVTVAYPERVTTNNRASMAFDAKSFDIDTSIRGSGSIATGVPSTYKVSISNIGPVELPAQAIEAYRPRVTMVLPAGATIHLPATFANGWVPYPAKTYAAMMTLYGTDPGNVVNNAKLAACRTWTFIGGLEPVSAGSVAAYKDIIVEYTPAAQGTQTMTATAVAYGEKYTYTNRASLAIATKGPSLYLVSDPGAQYTVGQPIPLGVSGPTHVVEYTVMNAGPGVVQALPALVIPPNATAAQELSLRAAASRNAVKVTFRLPPGAKVDAQDALSHGWERADAYGNVWYYTGAVPGVNNAVRTPEYVGTLKVIMDPSTGAGGSLPSNVYSVTATVSCASDRTVDLRKTNSTLYLVGNKTDVQIVDILSPDAPVQGATVRHSITLRNNSATSVGGNVAEASNPRITLATSSGIVVDIAQSIANGWVPYPAKTYAVIMAAYNNDPSNAANNARLEACKIWTLTTALDSSSLPGAVSAPLVLKQKVLGKAATSITATLAMAGDMVAANNRYVKSVIPNGYNIVPSLLSDEPLEFGKESAARVILTNKSNYALEIDSLTIPDANKPIVTLTLPAGTVVDVDNALLNGWKPYPSATYAKALADLNYTNAYGVRTNYNAVAACKLWMYTQDMAANGDSAALPLKYVAKTAANVTMYARLTFAPNTNPTALQTATKVFSLAYDAGVALKTEGIDPVQNARPGIAYPADGEFVLISVNVQNLTTALDRLGSPKLLPGGAGGTTVSIATPACVYDYDYDPTVWDRVAPANPNLASKAAIFVLKDTGAASIGTPAAEIKLKLLTPVTTLADLGYSVKVTVPGDIKATNNAATSYIRIDPTSRVDIAAGFVAPYDYKRYETSDLEFKLINNAKVNYTYDSRTPITIRFTGPATGALVDIATLNAGDPTTPWAGKWPVYTYKGNLPAGATLAVPVQLAAITPAPPAITMTITVPGDTNAKNNVVAAVIGRTLQYDFSIASSRVLEDDPYDFTVGAGGQFEPFSISLENIGSAKFAASDVATIGINIPANVEMYLAEKLPAGWVRTSSKTFVYSGDIQAGATNDPLQFLVGVRQQCPYDEFTIVITVTTKSGVVKNLTQNFRVKVDFTAVVGTPQLTLEPGTDAVPIGAGDAPFVLRDPEDKDEPEETSQPASQPEGDSSTGGSSSSSEPADTGSSSTASSSSSEAP